MSEQGRPKRCQRCGERLGEHGSYFPGLFRCADGTDVPWSRFNDGAGVECTCGLAWKGHPNPHAITCPGHYEHDEAGR